MKETYKVLAIRHRPSKLDDVIGQNLAVKSIKGFLKSGKVPQTLLISGPYGSGKTTTARIIARYVNCQNPVKLEGYVYGEPCGKCWSCVELDKSDPHHPDVHEINAAEERGIDAVRSWTSQSKYKPQSNFRVFIIDEVHAITGEAANAFLKPLEEPSKSTIWILCTTEPGRLLHTVRSRAVPIKIHDVSVEDCMDLLERVSAKEGFSSPSGKSAFRKVSEAARGHPREALQILESVINVCQVTDGKDINIDKLVTEVAAEVVGETPESSVIKYLCAMYLGKYTIPLAQIQGVSNPQLFLDTLMRYHMQSTRYAVSKILIDKYYLDYYSKLEFEGLLNAGNKDKPRDTAKGAAKKSEVLSPRMLAQLTESFFEAITHIKQYSVDPYVILFRMTVKATTLVIEHREKEAVTAALLAESTSEFISNAKVTEGTSADSEPANGIESAKDKTKTKTIANNNSKTAN